MASRMNELKEQRDSIIIKKHPVFITKDSSMPLVPSSQEVWESAMDLAMAGVRLTFLKGLQQVK